MRFSLPGILLFALAALGFAGNVSPLSLKDVSLMLRSGYSSAAVEQELAQRHFLGSLDSNGEKNLLQAGASPSLINGLKSGAFAVPAADVAAAKADLAVKEQRRAAEKEESRKLNTLYQAQLAQERKVAALAAANKSGAIASLVKGELVTSRNGVLRPYLDGEFEKKKLIALYHSAHWCAPCRKFTPQLIAFYNRVAAAHPEFEIVFVSNDKSPSEMEGYMRDQQMPWPAVTYDKAPGNAALMKYFGESIPCLVVVDESGKVIFDTYAGKNYRGPEAVLNELEQLFAGNGPTQIAQKR
jgi:nucleoredoxin